MTMRSSYPVKCECGHVGAILMSENDQPYSQPWERYKLENLNGNGGFNVEGFAEWGTVFKELKPSCPKCGAQLTPNNMNK